MGIEDFYNMDGEVISYEEWITLTTDFDGKRVALDEFDGYYISTVLLGMDHNWSGEGPPIIFETMVFYPMGEDGRLGPDLYCERYATQAEAREGHAKVVAALRNGQKPDGWYGDE